MRTIVRMPDIDKSGNYVIRDLDEPKVAVTYDSIMSIDGSTTNTGIGILRKSDGAVEFTCSCARESKESPVHYKVRLKEFIKDVLLTNPKIDTIYYEEPFVGYAEAAKQLFMLRTSIEEIIIENEPMFDYINHCEINNMKWKKLFLYPEKCPQGTELQKAAVRKKLISSMKYLEPVTQDEVDAICMGCIATVQLRQGTDDSLKSKKKVYPFKFNIRFIGADSDEDMAQELPDTYDGPKSLLQNGIELSTIKGTTNFDKHVYSSMQQDDKVLIIKFASNTHGDLILKYRIGEMSTMYKYLYAVVWRVCRK